MINRLQLLRNIGAFDSVADGANIPLAPLTLVYAENGRGKTTLAAILRSLATGDPIPIAERRRLAALHPPHAVLDCDGGPPAAMFQGNAWNRTLPNMVVFDDTFVDQNVYSGLVVGAEHRQKLHELILGVQAVTLNQQLQRAVERIEEHNHELRNRSAAITAVPVGMSVDDFCALRARPDLEEVLRATERNLAAAREREPIRNARPFDTILLPAFETAGVEQLLQEDLPALEAGAAARVQAHVAAAGAGGEAWIAEGMGRVAATAPNCPFCAQDLAGSPVIPHYQAYFSDAYTNLRERISRARAELHNTHSGDSPAAFERAVRVVVERRQFWAQFCDTPEVALDTAAIARDWQAAREEVAAVLNAKMLAPLERMTLAQQPVRAAIAAYEARRAAVAALDHALQQANEAIRLVKERAAAGNPEALAADLLRLNATRARHTPAVSPLCAAYLAERDDKLVTEIQRDALQVALERHRTAVFPGYQTAVNIYLQRFNAGFRLDSVTSTNTRGGPACSYNVLINNKPVAVAGATPVAGEPSFRTALSAGDRNTLALAFFFASLDPRPDLADHVVVVDDPISSLDEHRALTTVQEVRRLAERVGQIIVLSHSKPFLCRIWEGADPATRAAIEVSRDGPGSTIRTWDVNQDCITEHDRRHAALRDYLAANTPNAREVAGALRPVLEAFVRVAYPGHFPPGSLLGPFRNLCQQRVGKPQQILDASDTAELRDLVEYANLFHHDTNLAYATVTINDAELKGFAERTLAFTRR